MKIAGIVLIIAGVVALIYGGFSYTTTKKAVDMGPLQVNTKHEHSVPLPPVLGVIAIVGGGSDLFRREKGLRANRYFCGRAG
jgi:hypothetical protein